jgi:hypothetical protein
MHHHSQRVYTQETAMNNMISINSHPSKKHYAEGRQFKATSGGSGKYCKAGSYPHALI